MCYKVKIFITKNIVEKNFDMLKILTIISKVSNTAKKEPFELALFIYGAGDESELQLIYKFIAKKVAELHFIAVSRIFSLQNGQSLYSDIY